MPRGAVALCHGSARLSGSSNHVDESIQGIKCLARDRETSRILGESVSEYTLLLTNVREK